MSTAHRIIEALRESASGHRVSDVRLGLRYIAVKLDTGNIGVSCRFAENDHCSSISFPGDGRLTGREAAELLSWLDSENMLLRSIGLAAANALTSAPPFDSPPGNRSWEFVSGDILSVLELKAVDNMVMIGYFEPLIEAIRSRCQLKIYELDTSLAPGLEEASAAPEALRSCDVALITSITIINDTMDGLLESAGDCREVVILGPSTPLLPEAFGRTAATLLSGVKVMDDGIFGVVSEGGGMQQFKPYVRKVNYRLKEVH